MHVRRRSSFGRPGLAVVALAAAVLAGCSSTPLPNQPKLPPLSAVTLALSTDTLAVGASQLFTATAYDTNGAAVQGATFMWTSSDHGVCQVNSAGRVSAVGEGAALVIASAGGLSDTATVYVRAAANGWFAQASGTTNNLNGVAFLPDGHTGFAVGDVGTMVVTTDAGAHWSPRASGTSADLAGIAFSTSSVGWAVGTGGTLMKSVNGGLTWTRQVNLATSNNLAAVDFVDDRHGWVVGAAGLIARTVNGGASWTVRQWDSQPFHAVSFSDTLDGWAVGAGIVYGTHDGGVSWYKVQPSLTSQPLRSVSRLSGTQAWAVGGLGTVVSTSATADSLAWTLASAGAGYELNGVHMVDDQLGWTVGASGTGGAILVTRNGGATWSPQTSNTVQALNAVTFADPMRGWAVGAVGRIVHTSSAGSP
jgi:photosystem II stability/assembly factor-like uncharacterized protein